MNSLINILMVSIKTVKAILVGILSWLLWNIFMLEEYGYKKLIPMIKESYTGHEAKGDING